MIKRILILGILYVVSFAPLWGQNKILIDSLNLTLSTSKIDSVKVNVLLELATIYLREDYSKAADNAQQALDISSQKGLLAYEARSNRAMGLIFYYMGNYKKSTEHYFSALYYYEQTQDSSGIIAINNNLGAVYDRLLDFDKALIYYLKARDLLSQYHDPFLVARILPTLYNNIGNVYQTRKEISSAIEYYEKALELAKESKNDVIRAIALNNLGKLYLYDLNDVDGSFPYLQQGLELRKSLGDKSEISKSYNILAHYYRLKGDFNNAMFAVGEAIRLGQEIGSLESEKFGYANLSDIEKDRGNYKEALEAQTIFKNINDSIQSQLASSEISKLQLQYDFEKSEQEREREQKIARDRYIITIVSLATCLLIVILIAFLIRSKSRQTQLMQKNLSMDVEIKNKELTTNVMYLIRKNELINDVAERLLKILPNVLPENTKVVNNIILDLQREADNDSWKEFELRFNQVHTEFYDNLRTQYPDLSPAEEKLCAFLRLNMSSKEIAAITQQSTKSVEVARARLRKKLNLTNTASNLITHLSSI